MAIWSSSAMTAFSAGFEDFVAHLGDGLEIAGLAVRVVLAVGVVGEAFLLANVPEHARIGAAAEDMLLPTIRGKNSGLTRVGARRPTWMSACTEPGRSTRTIWRFGAGKSIFGAGGSVFCVQEPNCAVMVFIERVARAAACRQISSVALLGTR